MSKLNDEIRYVLALDALSNKVESNREWEPDEPERKPDIRDWFDKWRWGRRHTKPIFVYYRKNMWAPQPELRGPRFIHWLDWEQPYKFVVVQGVDSDVPTEKYVEDGSDGTKYHPTNVSLGINGSSEYVTIYVEKNYSWEAEDAAIQAMRKWLKKNGNGTGR